MFDVIWWNDNKEYSLRFNSKAVMKEFVIELRLAEAKYRIKSINPYS
jgi:hypothetical protein